MKPLNQNKMKNETFYKAKKINDKIDNLSNYLNKLYHSKGKDNVKEVKITYHVGQYNEKCEVILPPEASVLIKEMLLKEIDRVIEERDKLQDEFNNL
jgi:predicted transcriptional regulator